MKRIAVCVGGRPNYIKMAPIVRAIDEALDLSCILIDAGQHYSPNMRDVFFSEVGLREPNVNFKVGSGSHAETTSSAMLKMEAFLNIEPFDAVLVHGDMNYALGCALAAVKLHVPVIHNEAGLRSFDRRMPEEINRILIDHIATKHFTTEERGFMNLRDEGIYKSIYAVGSTLPEAIDYVCDGVPRWYPEIGHDSVVVTLHRPENVDDLGRLHSCMTTLTQIQTSLSLPVKMYCHPRTKKHLVTDLWPIEIVDPAGYREFIEAMLKSNMVITDSGGIQEETTILGVPCLTWRDNTERPVTCEKGTNTLVAGELQQYVETILESDLYPPKLPEHWDGKASERIVEILRRMK